MSETNSTNSPNKPGKLAVLLPGMGAVATTFIAGCALIRQGQSSPVGSYTQLGRLPGGPDVSVSEAVGLATLDDLVFGGWDLYEGTAFDAALRSDVLSGKHLLEARELLESVSPMPAVFDQQFVKNLSGPNVKTETSKMALAEALIQDVADFKAAHGADRAVAVWCGSTEVSVELESIHKDPDAFEVALKENDPRISPSMIYAYALIQAGVPYANGAPNQGSDIPALTQLAIDRGVPISGKDFKTGQTLMKTILAPGFASRLLGVHGWYSTNILGNLDGAVLDDPGSFRTKEMSKLSVLESILNRETHPDLYGDLHHKVRIDYYPPRGDNKEGWDNIDIFGWLGYPMQIKVNFLCRDSILAAPLVLDLALLMDLAGRQGRGGVQDWMSFFYKSPQQRGDDPIVHDLFAQLNNLNNTLLPLVQA